MRLTALLFDPPRRAPHQNALVELKFTYLAAKASAAMHAAGVPRERRLIDFLR
jgi:hypothetical protein